MLQPIKHDPNFSKLSVYVTREAYELLYAAAEKREREEIRPCPVDFLLNEMILKVFRPKKPGRGRPPKVAPKPIRSTKRVEGKTA